AFDNGMRKTLQAYTAPSATCMNTPATAINHRLLLFIYISRLSCPVAQRLRNRVTSQNLPACIRFPHAILQRLLVAASEGRDARRISSGEVPCAQNRQTNPAAGSEKFIAESAPTPLAKSGALYTKPR